MKYSSFLSMGFILLKALEFFVFPKMEMPETQTHMLCGWRQNGCVSITYQIKEAYVLANCNTEIKDKITYYPIYICAFISDEVEYPILSLDI